MIITIILGAVFLICQINEYFSADFNISDGIYGSVFFMLTGFHGFHVILGLFLLYIAAIRIVLTRPYLGVQDIQKYKNILSRIGDLNFERLDCFLSAYILRKANWKITKTPLTFSGKIYFYLKTYLIFIQAFFYSRYLTKFNFMDNATKRPVLQQVLPLVGNALIDMKHFEQQVEDSFEGTDEVNLFTNTKDSTGSFEGIGNRTLLRHLFNRMTFRVNGFMVKRFCTMFRIRILNTLETSHTNILKDNLAKMSVKFTLRNIDRQARISINISPVLKE